MCNPKIPKLEIKDPAPPPPPPEESAAYRQGAPEMQFTGRSKPTSNTRNRLRIDRRRSSDGRRTVDIR